MRILIKLVNIEIIKKLSIIVVRAYLFSFDIKRLSSHLKNQLSFFLNILDYKLKVSKKDLVINRGLVFKKLINFLIRFLFFLNNFQIKISISQLKQSLKSYLINLIGLFYNFLRNYLKLFLATNKFLLTSI